MIARPRALLALVTASWLAARPAAASQSLECTPGAPGTLTCWGGKLILRTAEMMDAKLADAAPGAREIVVGFRHACAPTPGGGLRCWGENDYGQVGDGTRVARSSPVRVHHLDDVTAVALGGYMTCALRGAGTVACWGHDGATGARRPLPVAVPALDHAVELVAGSEHACARRDDGSVWCWGNNHYGSLGDGTRKARRRPVRVVGLTDAAELSAGNEHTCARRRDGSVWCWGNGVGGEDGTADRLLVPERVRAIRGASALVKHGDGFLALQKDGALLSCRYDVGPDRDESSPKLVCHRDRAPRASGFMGTQIAIRRP